MPERTDIYKCAACGNIVYMLHEGPGELICCGEPMKAEPVKVKASRK